MFVLQLHAISPCTCTKNIPLHATILLILVVRLTCTQDTRTGLARIGLIEHHQIAVLGSLFISHHCLASQEHISRLYGSRRLPCHAANGGFFCLISATFGETRSRSRVTVAMANIELLCFIADASAANVPSHYLYQQPCMCFCNPCWQCNDRLWWGHSHSLSADWMDEPDGAARSFD